MGGVTQGRILAPLALLAAVVALVLVVKGSSSSDSQTASQTTSTQTTPKKKKAKVKAKAKTAKSYTVKSGDTLAAIAQQTKVPVAQIEELNPGLDPAALTVGQKVKLAP
jgi:LysM repeat protein